MNRRQLSLLVPLLALAASAALASDNSAPVVSVSAPTGRPYATAMAGDGSIAMVGQKDADFWVRLLPLGATFSECRFPSLEAGARAAAYQPDRKLLMAGYSNGQVEIARLSAGACQLDNGFGLNGHIVYDFFDPVGIAAMAVQADGRAVLVGFIGYGAPNYLDILVIRLNPDGSLDSSFDGNGIKGIHISGADEAKAVDVANDGTIVIGADIDVSGSNPRGVVIRLTPSGALDTAFGGSGKVIVDSTSNAEYVRGVAILRDNGVAVSSARGVRVLGSTGSLRTTFTGDGFLSVASLGFEVGDLAEQSDGKFLVEGTGQMDFNGTTSAYWVVARLLSNGAFDTDFGTNGFVKAYGQFPFTLPGASLAHVGGFISQGGSSVFDGAIHPALIRLTTSLVFTDSFTYGLQNWTKSVGNVSRLTSTQQVGSYLLITYRLRAQVTGGAESYVETDEPIDMAKVRVTFDLDPDTWDGGQITVLELREESGRSLVGVDLHPTGGGGAEIRAKIKHRDGTYRNGPWHTISRANHAMELVWYRDDTTTPLPDGSVTLLMDGDGVSSVVNVDTGSGKVGAIRFGGFNSSSYATGQVLLDDFRAERWW